MRESSVLTIREASIHITEKQLTQILEEVDDAFKDDPTMPYSKEIMARMIVEKGKAFSLSHRSIAITNDKLQKKAEKVQLVGRTDTGLFAEIMALVRRKMKHRAIRLIKPGETEWLQVKEITYLANEFCTEFQLNKKPGYTEYLIIAINKMNKFSLNKFKSLHAAIFINYEAQIELASDKTPEETEFCYKIYISIINSRIGHEDYNYKQLPEKYVCFKKAKDEAKKMKLPIKQYIDAQFEAMEWVNAIPDPLQLYGDKAIERARKYCFQHNIQLTKKSLVNFSKIKGK